MIGSLVSLLSVMVFSTGVNLALASSASDSNQTGPDLVSFQNQAGLYRDFFDIDTNGKKLRYQIRTEFKTSMGKQAFTQKVRKAFREAVAKTLSSASLEKDSGGAENQITSILRKNVQAALIDNFILSLFALKVVNSTIQVDIHFLPIADDANDLTVELDNNSLVLLSDKGRLREQLLAIDRSSVLSSIKSVITKQLKPISKSGATYLGGSLTLQLKIADIDLRQDPGSFGGNLVKGLVRYRRYFATANQSGKIGVNSGKTHLSAYGVYSPGIEGAGYITVDVNKTFNLKNVMPKVQDIVVFPGILVDVEKSSEWGFEPKPWKGRAGLWLQGSFASNYGPEKFAAHLKTAKYDVAGGAWKYDIDLKGVVAEPDSPTDDNEIAANEIKTILNTLQGDREMAPYLGSDYLKDIGVRHD